MRYMGSSRWFDLLVSTIIVLGVGTAITTSVLYGCDSNDTPKDTPDTTLVIADTVKQYEPDPMPDNGHDRPAPVDVVVNPSDTTYTVTMTDSTTRVSYINPIVYEHAPFIEVELANRIRVILEKNKVAYIVKRSTMKRIYP